jgi:hypothetical protein
VTKPGFSIGLCLWVKARNKPCPVKALRREKEPLKGLKTGKGIKTRVKKDHSDPKRVGRDEPKNFLVPLTIVIYQFDRSPKN